MGEKEEKIIIDFLIYSQRCVQEGGGPGGVVGWSCCLKASRSLWQEMRCSEVAVNTAR